MKQKDIRVGLIDIKLKTSLEKLKEGRFEDKKLHKLVNRAIDDLKNNPFCGIHIPKKLIPKEYAQKYKIDNLWKYNLPNAWRLLYTVKEDEIIILAIILEWLSHKDYERRFKYG